MASGAAPDFELKVRKVAVDLGKRPGQKLKIEGSRDGERQRRDFALLDLGGDLFGGDRAIIALLEQRLHAVAEIGQMTVAAFAPDQLTAEFILELLDRAGERGLRHVALLRRAREVQRARNGQEITNLLHFHAERPFATLYASRALRTMAVPWRFMTRAAAIVSTMLATATQACG